MQTALNCTSVHVKSLSRNTFYPAGVGLNRSSHGLNVFVKAGLSWLRVGWPPLTRGLKGWISENFHLLSGIIQEGKMRTLRRYKLAKLVYGCRIQINKIMTRAKKFGVSGASGETIIGIRQINQANMHQQGITTLQISRLSITYSCL